jgi:hypothetical protein
MEHQTMTSTTSFGEDVIAHELGHQWFGDLITCANWQELWLNEGFATYTEALFREAAHGPASYRQHIGQRMQAALNSPGTLYVQDTSTVAQLFRFDRVYAKGASVLHMLRHVLGDSVFFRSLRAYVADPRYRYGVATTAGFRGVCESVSGLDLGYFFDQWVFDEGYPVYSAELFVSGDADGYVSTVRLAQSAGTRFFVMPVDLKLTGGSRDTTIVAFHQRDRETFTVRTSWPPDRVAVDPDGWILKEVIDPAGVLPTAVALELNYPNPFNAGTTIAYALPGTRTVLLSIFDAAGQLVRTLDEGSRTAGEHVVVWDGRTNEGIPAASGAYFTRLQAGSAMLSRPMLLLR